MSGIMNNIGPLILVAVVIALGYYFFRRKPKGVDVASKEFKRQMERAQQESERREKEANATAARRDHAGRRGRIDDLLRPPGDGGSD